MGKKKVFSEVRMFMLWQSLEWMQRVVKETAQIAKQQHIRSKVKELEDLVVRFDNFMAEL